MKQASAVLTLTHSQYLHVRAEIHAQLANMQTSDDQAGKIVDGRVSDGRVDVSVHGRLMVIHH